MNLIEKARLQRQNILISSSSLDDKTASQTPELFGKLNYNSELIKVGTRINWRGVLKRAAVDIWDREENDPDHAPQLWEDILYKNGIRIIPDVITAGTAFQKDEFGYWGNDLYKSLIDNNVWTPDAYPSGWELI